jgi:hypothetical protein
MGRVKFLVIAYENHGPPADGFEGQSQHLLTIKSGRTGWLHPIISVPIRRVKIYNIPPPAKGERFPIIPLNDLGGDGLKNLGDLLKTS